MSLQTFLKAPLDPSVWFMTGYRVDNSMAANVVDWLIVNNAVWGKRLQ